MVRFFSLLVTGSVCGMQIWWVIMWGVWGRPVQMEEIPALFASFGLVVASYLSLFRPRGALILGAIFLFPLWWFYLPVLWMALSSGKLPLRGLITLFPAIALTWCTVFIVSSLWRGRFSAPSFRVRKGVIIVSATLVALVIVTDYLFVGVDDWEEIRSSATVAQVSGRKVVQFHFEKAGFDTVETDDARVIALVEASVSKTYTIRLSFTRDFARIRALNLNEAYVQNIKFTPWVDWRGTSR